MPRPPEGTRAGAHSRDVAEWVVKNLKFEPDAKQAAFLSSASRRGIVNCSRQWGKSFIAAAKAVHQASTRPKSLTLVVSPCMRQSAELILKLKQHLTVMGIRPRGDGHNAVSVQFPNGSRVIGLPAREATIRGFSAASLVLIDEASRVPDELYGAIRPMLATTNGALWMMSTPWGKRGFFYQTWAKGGNQWDRISVPATECARISREHLDDERATMSERHFRQEYLCEFAANEDGAFDMDAVERALDDGFGAIAF